jgi:hypothetical protein
MTALHLWSHHQPSAPAYDGTTYSGSTDRMGGVSSSIYQGVDYPPRCSRCPCCTSLNLSQYPVRTGLFFILVNSHHHLVNSHHILVNLHHILVNSLILLSSCVLSKHWALINLISFKHSQEHVQHSAFRFISDLFGTLTAACTAGALCTPGRPYGPG